jgi:putative hydrolase of HD superfamily
LLIGVEAFAGALWRSLFRLRGVLSGSSSRARTFSGGIAVISRGLVELFFSGFSIERWNDHPRPVQLTEMDKQAHKCLIAWAIASWEEGGRGNASLHPSQADGTFLADLVEGAIFEFLHRLVLTDIKPPVFSKMMERHGDELNAWVIRELSPFLEPLKGNVAERFAAYWTETGAPSPERAPFGVRRILRAAHYLATRWEFELLYPLARNLYGAERTRENINGRLREHLDMPVVKNVLDSLAGMGTSCFADFVNLLGQLRFQKRWSRTPRVPQTSVLGHMLFVALLAYSVSLEAGLSRERAAMNFLGGLFHDLPEVLTRDIISPVKRAVEGLDDLVKECEREMMEETVLPLLPKEAAARVRFLTEREFEDRLFAPSGIVSFRNDEEIPEGAFAVNGTLLDGCDKLAAFLEASFSIRHGITSPSLEEARTRLFEAYAKKTFRGVSLQYLFEFFR